MFAVVELDHELPRLEGAGGTSAARPCRLDDRIKRDQREFVIIYDVVVVTDWERGRRSGFTTTRPVTENEGVDDIR